MMKAILAGLLFSLPAAAKPAPDWKSVKGEVEKNSASIKTLRGEVEITLAMPMATLSDKFKIVYKQPHMLKLTSVSDPASYLVHRRDTTYLSPESKGKQTAALMNSLQLDKQGMLFNFLSGMAGDDAKASTCGEDVCFSVEKELSAGLRGQSGDTSVPKQAAINLVYSPRTKCLKEIVTASGPALSRTTLECQDLRGIRAPKTLAIQAGPVSYRLVFRDITLNGKATDQEFR